MRWINLWASIFAFAILFFIFNVEVSAAIIASAVAGIAFAGAVNGAKIIAFDMGGVMVDGDYWTDELKPNKDMVSLVNRLRENYKVVLLTNQNSFAHDAFDKKFGLAGIFDDQIVSGKVGAKKPEAKYFDLALQKLGAKPKDIIFIDDDRMNVDAAKKKGIKAIQFSSASKLADDLKRNGIAV